MAFIPYIDEDEAEPSLAKLYAGIVDPDTGRVDHILKIHGADPPALRAHLALYRSVMRDSDTLPRVERELIAYTVSRLNQCHY